MTGARTRAPIGERLRYLSTFAEHVALAAALKTQRPRRGGDRTDGLHAVFLSPHPPSHLGTVARFTRWVPHLERRGCSVEVLTAASEAEFADYRSRRPGADTRYHHVTIRNTWRNLRRAATADVVVLHRGLFPFSPWQRPTFERELARLNRALVYDFYDSIWVDRRAARERPASRLGHWLQPPDKIEDVIGLAQVVTVSNEPLAQFARRYNADVRIVPMLLEPGDYIPREHTARSPVVLGWSGSANNIPRLLALTPVLQRVAAQRDVRIRVVAPERVQIPDVQVESLTHPWSPDSEASDFATMDVGLLPLDPDSATDREKSPFKLLQYMAAGLPVVATPIAIDDSIVKPGDAYLAAKTEDEWVEALSRLVDEAALRARLGETARRVVVDHYSFERHADAFVEILQTAAERGRH